MLAVLIPKTDFYEKLARARDNLEGTIAEGAEPNLVGYAAGQLAMLVELILPEKTDQEE